MGFNLFSGNRLEQLATEFLCRRRERLPEMDVFAPETVVVQTRGMAVWLTRFLVDKGEMAANIKFPFLQNFVDGVLPGISGSATELKLFDPGVLTWRIARILLEENYEYPELAHYLETDFALNENRQLKVFRLAKRLARLFDRYQLYIPEILARWQYETPDTAPGNWQAKLWRKLTMDGKIKSRADLLISMLCSNRKIVPMNSVSVFGIGVMAPWYLKFFRKLSTTTEVDFYYLNPCAEYWADHPVKFELGRRDFTPPPEELTNPLLTAWGLQGREFFKRIVELDEEVNEEANFDFWYESGDAPKNLLEAVKGDIVRVATPETGSKIIIAPDDDSITLHSCAGPGRMLEVLHDRLLYLIQKHSYTLNDIVVMSPEIDEFAPYIRAIFDRGEFKNRYAISDRTVRNANVLADGFFALLELATGRFEASSIFEILYNEAVKRKFGFSDVDLEILSQYVARANIRWGLDNAMRREFAGVDFVEFSWQLGLDRMLMGAAFDDVGKSKIDYPGGMIPLNYADSGERLEKIASLCRFVRLLGEISKKMSVAKSGGEWMGFLSRVLDEFFLTGDDDADDFASLRRSFEELAGNIELAKYNDLIDFVVVKEALAKSLEKPGGRDPFLAGKITFSSLMPMRSVPGKVVVLLGMNEGIFPRQDREENFDLISGKLDCSAASGRWEDNYLFLEALLAAREKLLIFYRGEDDRKVCQYASALPVAELYEYIHRIAENPEVILLKHPLQPFDPDNFSQVGEEILGVNRKFSYSRTFLNLASGSVAGTRKFFDGFEAMEIPQIDRISLEELERFFVKTTQNFWEKRLQSLSYLKYRAKLNDEEILEPGSLELSILQKRVTDALANELSHVGEAQESQKLEEAKNKLFQRLKSEGMLPLGEAGSICFDEITPKNLDFLRRWAAQEKAECQILLPSGVTLSGVVEVDREHNCIIDYCFSTLSGKYYINMGLRYLLLAASTDKPLTGCIIEQKSDKTFQLAGIGREKAVAILEELVAIYLEGLSRPLPFFAKTSMEKIFLPDMDAKEFENERKYDQYIRIAYPEDYLSDSTAMENFVDIAQRAFGWLIEYGRPTQ